MTRELDGNRPSADQTQRMTTHAGGPRTLAGDLARLRAAAAIRPGAALAAVAAALCTVLTFGSAALGSSESGPSATGHDVAFPGLPGERARPAGRHGKHARPAAQSPHLRVSRLHVDAQIVPVTLRDDGVLEPPADVDHVGWWDQSAGAGARDGQTVLTGHTVHGGGGVMEDLEDLTTGDVVRISDRSAEVDYRVTRVVTWSKAKLARRALDVFGQDRHPGRLVMVTCENWDGKGFESNVIAFARPARPPAESRLS